MFDIHAYLGSAETQRLIIADQALRLVPEILLRLRFRLASFALVMRWPADAQDASHHHGRQQQPGRAYE